jgi:hypothetical protein
MKKISLRISVVVLGLLAMAGRSQAQDIAWDSAVYMNGDTDISTPGAYFDAVYFGGSRSPSYTDQGVTFNSLTTFGTDPSGDITLSSGGSTGNGGAVNGAYPAYPTSSSASATYSDIVSGLAYAYYMNDQTDIPAETVTLSNLTNGDAYQVQVWCYDGYDTPAKVDSELTGANSTSFTKPYIGQFAIGTFTANGQTETFNVVGPAAGFAIMNAVSVQAIVPEPATCGIMAAGFGMLLAGKCFRRRD